MYSPGVIMMAEALTTTKIRESTRQNIRFIAAYTGENHPDIMERLVKAELERVQANPPGNHSSDQGREKAPLVTTNIKAETLRELSLIRGHTRETQLAILERLTAAELARLKAQEVNQ